MIKFLTIFLAINLLVAGLISMIYVLACFIAWSILPLWTSQDVRPETFRVIEVCLACVALMLSLDQD